MLRLITRRATLFSSFLRIIDKLKHHLHVKIKHHKGLYISSLLHMINLLRLIISHKWFALNIHANMQE